MKYQIIHADRDFRYHQKLKTALAAYADVHFLDHCCYLDSALQLLHTHRPSILLTASKLYDEPNVIEAFCTYRDAAMPDLKIIALTSKEDLDHFLNSIVAGVEGYIAKSCSFEEIHQCITNIMNGDNYLGVHKSTISHK